MGRERIFRFKQFNVSHKICAHKVGVDGVLIAAWANVQTADSILDVGTGCGLIALMCAQRNRDAFITGIDVDSDSIIEAKVNFEYSPWANRLLAINENIIDDIKNNGVLSCQKFDHIISNPPYYNSGLNDISLPRLKARHYGELSPVSLIEIGRKLLNDGGVLSMIFPFDQLEYILSVAEHCGMKIERICNVRGNPDSDFKRSMVELRLDNNGVQQSVKTEQLIIETSRGKYSPEYISLCSDFYLKF